MEPTASTYRVSTIGCRVNRADSLAIERDLETAGLRRAMEHEVPEVWIVNTCAVTSEGMKKSRKLVRKCARSGAAVVVTGCGADFRAEELEAPGVEEVLPNSRKEEAAGAAIALTCRAGGPVGASGWKPDDLARVPVKVQDGCRRYCSYCIVPYLRPPPYSKPATRVIEEVRSLAGLGAGEVILCGIDLGCYRDPDSGSGLDGLVSAVLEAAPDTWVRLSSIEISDVSEGLVGLLAGRNLLCRHLHLPLQSGDPLVLAGMRRDYTPLEFAGRIAQLRREVAGLAVTTDVMVGFPGEDDRAFENTRLALGSTGFSRVHVFKYSPRAGTAAFKLGDPVPPDVKQARAAELRDLAETEALRFHRAFVGRIIPVLVEATMEKEPGRLFARAESFAGVVVEGDGSLIGERVSVLIESAGAGVMRGTIVDRRAGTGGE